MLPNPVEEEEEAVAGVKKEVAARSQQEEVKKVVQAAKKVEEEVVEEVEEVEVEEKESKVNVPQILTVLLLTPLALNGVFANVPPISLVTRTAGGKEEVVEVVKVVAVVAEAVVAEAVVAEAVVVEEVQVEEVKECVRLMGIALLRILYALNGDSASVPLTSQEERTVGARVGEEEEEEPVARTLTVLQPTRSARSGASVSVQNTSQGTLTAILELHSWCILVFVCSWCSLYCSLSCSLNCSNMLNFLYLSPWHCQ